MTYREKLTKLIGKESDRISSEYSAGIYCCPHYYFDIDWDENYYGCKNRCIEKPISEKMCSNCWNSQYRGEGYKDSVFEEIGYYKDNEDLLVKAIKKFGKDIINWDYLLKEVQLSEDFIKEFQDKVD